MHMVNTDHPVQSDGEQFGSPSPCRSPQTESWWCPTRPIQLPYSLSYAVGSARPASMFCNLVRTGHRVRVIHARVRTRDKVLLLKANEIESKWNWKNKFTFNVDTFLNHPHEPQVSQHYRNIAATPLVVLKFSGWQDSLHLQEQLRPLRTIVKVSDLCGHAHGALTTLPAVARHNACTIHKYFLYVRNNRPRVRFVASMNYRNWDPRKTLCILSGIMQKFVRWDCG